MGLSNAEVKLRRLLASMPNQDNSRKLVHYVATARELLTVLTGENAQQALPSISQDKAREYAQRIEAFAEKLNLAQVPDVWEAINNTSSTRERAQQQATPATNKSTLRKRHPQTSSQQEEAGPSQVKLDEATQEHIAKHRRLQDDLTDEMLLFAQQMKDSTLRMQESLRDSEKVLDATADAVERNLASTNRVTRKAGELYSRGSLTGCYTWLLVFLMFCIFVFMIAVIRVT